MPTPFLETSGWSATAKTLVPTPSETLQFDFAIFGNPERQVINDIAPFANINLAQKMGGW